MDHYCTTTVSTAVSHTKCVLDYVDSKLSRDLLCYIVGSSRRESSSDTVVAKHEKSLILQHCERFWQSKDSYKESSQQQINNGVFFGKS